MGYKQDFERDGVAKIEGVFTLDEVDKMRADAIMSIGRARDFCHSRVRVQTRDLDGVDFPALSFFPALSSRYLNKVRCDERLRSVVCDFLGPNVKQLNNQFYFRLPGDDDQFEWHQDIFFRQPPEDFPGIQNAYLQTAIIIDEQGPESGGVEYVRGSHKSGDLHLIDHNASAPDKLRQYTKNKFIGERFDLKPGDLLVWSVMIVHGSQVNISRTPRMVYMNGFGSAHASKYFPYYTKDGKVIQHMDIKEFKEKR